MVVISIIIVDLLNSITAMNINCSTVDTTFTGMGRGAGNAETELLLAYEIEKDYLLKVIL